VETYTYDAFCRPYDTNNAGTGGFTKVRFENEGNPASQAVTVYEPASSTGQTQIFTRTYYDGLGRPWRTQSYGDTLDAAKRHTDTAYDARGNIAKLSLPYFAGETALWAENSYDWRDRVVKTVNPDASQKSYTYAVQAAASLSGSTNLPVMEERSTDEEGKLRRTWFDKDQNVILTSGNLSSTWINETRSYDVLGRLKGVRDHSGAVWSYTYDLVGNRLTASDPDLGNWSYTYDNANQLLNYDQMHRLLTKKVKGAGETTATPVATNTYDTAEAGTGSSPFHNVGLLTVSTNGNAKYSYSRTLTGSGTVLTTKTTINGLTQTAIDRQGKAGLTLSKSFLPGAVNVGTTSQPWTYNAANKLLTIPGYVTGASYEADGQTRSITYANGVTTAFTYDAKRDWLARVTTKMGTTSLLDNQYSRDKLGRITGINGLTTSDDWTYSYDDLSRLVTATNTGTASLSETYTYANNGNLTSRTKMGNYTYPSGTAVRPHAATKIGTKTLTYDANGNMLADGSRTLEWDRSNQLASVTQSGAEVTFAYGPDGARVKKIWPFGTVLYAGADVEIDRTTVGSEIYTIYPHPDIKITAGPTAQTGKFYLHRDHLASVRVVTDDAGVSEEKTNYAAYGEPTNKAMATKKGYIGERFDAETGLMYLNARYYDPAFGRFVPGKGKSYYA
ncbi:MAG: RHS repeat protein, partial [Alphaproteobacteria bacterium]